MTESGADYLLGHADREHSRLAEQHLLWREGLLTTLRANGLRPGARVLEVGCGGGHLLADLALAADARGLELDPVAATRARARAGCPVAVGDVATAPLGGPYDLIVARWVFSFLREPGAVAERLGEALTDDGVLVIQDYDHDGIGVWPRRASIDAVIEAYRSAYADAGGDLWVAARLPALLAAAGWQVLSVSPDVKVGRPGDHTWRWVERFVTEHLHTLVAGGQLAADGAHAFRQSWATAVETPGALLVTPIHLTVVARPPR